MRSFKEKAEAERVKAEEKRRVQAEREASKAKTSSKAKSGTDRFLGNILGSAGSAIGRKITNKILKDIFK